MVRVALGQRAKSERGSSALGSTMTMILIIWNQIGRYDHTMDAVSDRTLGFLRTRAIGVAGDLSSLRNQQPV